MEISKGMIMLVIGSIGTIISLIMAIVMFLFHKKNKYKMMRDLNKIYKN